MGETLVGLAQLGAIGLIALFLYLLSKVLTPVLTAWVTRKTNTPPEPPKHYDYNQQMATLVYDNSKNMSEMVVATQNNTEILKEVVRDQQELLRVMREHAQKAGAFYDSYSKTILKKLDHMGMSD